jgi:hypothetical protein
VEVRDSDKHSSLQQYRIYYDPEKFYDTGPQGEGGELGGVVIKKRGCTYYLEKCCWIESYSYYLNPALGSRFTFKTTTSNVIKQYCGKLQR